MRGMLEVRGVQGVQGVQGCRRCKGAVSRLTPLLTPLQDKEGAGTQGRPLRELRTLHRPQILAICKPNPSSSLETLHCTWLCRAVPAEPHNPW